MHPRPLPRPRWWAGAALAAALALGVLGLSPRHAEAHARYLRSAPAFAEELPASPTRIDLWFSQELFREEGANTITLTDASGTAWPTGPLVLDRQDRTHVFAPLLETLPPGRYFAAWTTLSADDGDDDAGAYAFYVGRAPSPAEIAADRERAGELLIPYPGDAPPEQAAGAEPPPPPRPVAAAEQERDGGIDGAVIGLGVVSALAVVGLTVTRRRPGGG